MSATVSSYGPLEGEEIGWTEHELDEVPESVRYEIEDGNLIVSPRPTLHHQGIGLRLAMALAAECPEDWWPTLDAEIRVYEDEKVTQARSPDVMLVPRSATMEKADRRWASPKEVALAIEVVSPSSRVADRITKVGQYAQWGIPLYLRVERQPSRAVFAYILDPPTGLYRTPVEHRDIFVTDDPFRIRIDLAQLV